MMESGIKVEITNGLGIPDRLVGRMGIVVASSIGGDQTLIRVPDEGSWWMYNCRLKEVDDDGTRNKSKDNRHFRTLS